MQAQDYVIKSIKKGKAWSKEGFGDFQSYSLAVEGIGEPVSLNKKMPVTAEPQVGDTIYGTLEEKEYDGKTYYKFKGAKKNEFGAKPKLDPLTMYVSYAKDVFVAMYQANAGIVDSQEFTANMQLIAEQGKQLMNNVQ